jgi:hypothetical protein
MKCNLVIESAMISGEVSTIKLVDPPGFVKEMVDRTSCITSVSLYKNKRRHKPEDSMIVTKPR